MLGTGGGERPLPRSPDKPTYGGVGLIPAIRRVVKERLHGGRKLPFSRAAAARGVPVPDSTTGCGTPRRAPCRTGQ
jgi:hypothetical protein